MESVRNNINAYIFFSAFFFFAIFAPFGNIPSDTEYSIETAKSIYYKHSLSIEKSDKFWSLTPTRQGKYQSKYGIGYAFIFIPHVICADIISKFFNINFNYILNFFISFTNTILAAFIALIFFLIFITLGYSYKISLISTGLLCIASPLLPYSKIIHAEIPSLLLILLFILGICKKPKLNLKNGFYFGFIASSLYLIKISNILISLIILSYIIYLYLKKNYSNYGILGFSVFFVIPFLLLLFRNYHYYGSICNFGYGEEQKRFSTPFFEGLFGYLFSPSKSIFIFSPLIIFSFYSFSSFLKSHKIVCIYISLIFFSYIFLFSQWWDWSGGWCFGPRLIIPAVILCNIFIVDFISKFNKNIIKKIFFVILLIFSFYINLLGTLVWYQQIYYFNKDFFSISNSHPIIATKIFFHKLLAKPEIYDCNDYNINCSQSPYTSVWKDITKNNKLDFSSFEKFNGFAIMWIGLYKYFGWKWPIFIPFIFFFVSIFLFFKVLTNKYI
jgi:hypothetical protein